MASLEATSRPILTYIVLSDVNEAQQQEDGFTAIITPMYVSPLKGDPNGLNRECTCDIEVTPANLARVTGMLTDNSAVFRVTEGERGNSIVTIHFGMNTVWTAVAQMRKLFSGITFAPPVYFYAFDGNAESRPDMLVVDEQDGEDRIITVRQHIGSENADDDDAVEPYSEERWRRYYEAVADSGILNPLALDDPAIPEHQVTHFGLTGVLSLQAHQNFGYSLVLLINLFPRS